MARRIRAARSSQIAALGAKGGARYVGATLRGVGRSGERKDELREAALLRTAEDVAERLGHMKGALMKLGQMASYIDQAVPENVRAVFADLQQKAPPMSFDLARSVIETELGDLSGFADIDPEPVAAASIGQVHRAVTVDGRDVAVKVQYPGVDDAIRADLANSDLLFSLLGMVFKGLDAEPVVAELRARVSEELDYRIEADNQREFAAFYDGHPVVRIPAVIDALSSRRVLTTTYAAGVDFDEMTSRAAEQRNLTAETLYRFVFGGIYQLAIFNGDPHPGNYRFGDDGVVTFLDFGLCKRFTPADLDVFRSMITTMVLEPDMPGFIETLTSAGFVQPGTVLSPDAARDYFGHFYALVAEPGAVEVTPDYASAVTRRFFDVSGEHGEIISSMNLPPSMVVVQRINLGLYSLLGDLRATCDWRHIAEEIWPFVDSPEPVTDIGRAVRDWERRRRIGGDRS